MPGGRQLPERVAAGRLEPDDARAEALQLSARERAGEVAAEVDDEEIREGFHPRRSYYTQTAVPDRSNKDKRRLLLDAAVRVFARKGYHAARVGDIAEEAGVAHGLLYHYFESKEEVLGASSARRGTS